MIEDGFTELKVTVHVTTSLFSVHNLGILGCALFCYWCEYSLCIYCSGYCPK